MQDSRSGRFCRHQSARERFLNFILPNPITGCWNWLGNSFQGKRGDRYGRFRDGTKKQVNAHRFAYELWNGPITNGLWVLHCCDNGLCVNPDHLFLGTQIDNEADKDAKGRRLRGASHPNSTLTEEKVRAIFYDTRPRKILEAEYGVSKATICHIKLKYTWSHLWQ